MATSWVLRCAIVGLISGYITVSVINFAVLGDSSWWMKAVAGILACFGALLTVAAFHISTIRCSNSHTLRSVVYAYVIFTVARVIAPFISSTMTKVWRHPREAQEKLLKTLIKRDEKTEYGRRYLSGIQSLDEFRRKHPLTKYDHYESYFKRLADGEKNVCIATTVGRFGISSGTTGKGKLIPMVFMPRILTIMSLAYPKDITRGSVLQKILFLYCKPIEMFTKSGHAVAPAVFFPDEAMYRAIVSANCASPFKAHDVSSDFEATYIHVLFGVADRQLSVFYAPFASQIYRACRMLEEEQDKFLEDITLGRVHTDLKIDEDVRRALNAALVPDPARASELRKEFAKGFVGIIGRIWPSLTYVSAIDISGYFKKLESRYAKGTRLFTIAYGCTESQIGINLGYGKLNQYVLVPNDSIVEFIPENQSEEDNPRTVCIDEAQIGKRYEVVITTVSGLYRYRMGDVIEVVDFHENCPVVQVKYRTGELLNLRSEKIDRLVANNAIQEMAAVLTGATLVEWTCAESPLMYQDDSRVDYDQFYLLFVEFEAAIDVILTDEQKSMFDTSMRKQHEFYNRYRNDGTICDPRVMVVRRGTFERLKEYIIAHSTASYNQFKMPKKLRTKATLDLMMESVINP